MVVTPGNLGLAIAGTPVVVTPGKDDPPIPLLGTLPSVFSRAADVASPRSAIKRIS